MLNNMQHITVKDMQQMQTNNYNVFAEMALPLLLNNIAERNLSQDESYYLRKLKNWNLTNNVNEEGPTIFNLWWKSLDSLVFHDEFSKTTLPLKQPEESTLLEALLRDSAFKFVDDITTPKVEKLPDLVLIAFKAIYPQLQKADSEQSLAWGAYKATGIKHLLRLPALSRLNLPIGGGQNVINATTENHGPSWRMIVQLSDKIDAYGVYPGGQSGNPGSKYYDSFINDWAAGNYYSLLFYNRQEAKNSDKIKWKMTFSNA